MTRTAAPGASADLSPAKMSSIFWAETDSAPKLNCATTMHHSRSAGKRVTNRISLCRLAKQCRCIFELRSKPFPYFRTDLVTATVNSGSNRSFNISRLRAEAAAHLAHAFLNDAFHRAAPSGMQHANCRPLRIRQNHWQTIRSEYCEHDAGRLGNQAVSCESLLG